MPGGERLDDRPQEPTRPEVLALGPRPSRRWLRWGILLTLVALAGPLARVAVWELVKPPPDFTLAQLQGAYYGMVRSDGTNDMSTIDGSKFPDPPMSVEPQTCTPLFASTVSNQFPAEAVDGVSTYWLNEGSASISLFTLRYASTDAAVRAYTDVDAALGACDGKPIRFERTTATGAVRVVPVTYDSGVTAQLAFVLDGGGAGRYAFSVMQLSNTVSWQYRYDARPGPYQSLPAQQLMDGLAAQLRFIQDQSAGRGPSRVRR